MMNLQLEHVRTFLAVIEHGTFEAAARAQQLTPSAVSQRIKALEVSVGRVLLQRTKPVSATESGAAILRLARQLALLENDALASLSGVTGDEGRSVRIPIVVNADSLATWMPAALAAMPSRFGATFEIYREDEGHSIDLLRNGMAMAAVTSVADAVQGCEVRSLGRMRYRPAASPEFVRRWFADGVTADALSRAPMVVFDRKDPIQDRYLQQRSRRRLDPPRHFIPASTEFMVVIGLGLGWGMTSELQAAPRVAAGEIVYLDGDAIIDVPLYWQRWNLQSPALQALSDVVEGAAERLLR